LFSRFPALLFLLIILFRQTGTGTAVQTPFKIADAGGVMRGSGAAGRRTAKWLDWRTEGQAIVTLRFL
jgi:hypothetical protein